MKSVGSVGQEVAGYEDGDGFGGGEFGVELEHLCSCDGEWEGGRDKVGARDGDGGVDEEAVVGAETGSVPIHGDEDVGITWQCLAEREGDDIDGGRILGVGEELDVSCSHQAICPLGQKQKEGDENERPHNQIKSERY